MSDKPHVEIETSVKQFDDFLRALEPVRDEGRVKVTEENLFSEVLGDSNVQMCVSKLSKNDVDSFDLKHCEELIVGMKFGRVRELLKGISSTEKLQVEMPVERNSKNQIYLHAIDEGVEFYCPLVNKADVPKLPNKDPISCETRIKVPGTDLKKTAKHANKIVSKETGSILFKTEGKQLQISAESKTEGSFTETFKTKGGEGENELGEHEVEIGFRFLENIKKVLGNSEVVTVHVKTSYPIRFDVDIEGGDESKVIYIIAPRLDDQ